MKRTVALFLALLLLAGTVSVSAKEVFSVSVPQYIEEGRYLYETVPLAVPMRKLGYVVSYKDGIVTASKNYENEKVTFIFNIPKALFSYTVNGESFEGFLDENPFIYNGVTYVDISFFENYVSKFENVDFSWDVVWNEKYVSLDYCFSAYNFEKEREELKNTYKLIVDEYAKYGIDINSEQAKKADITFDTKFSCDTLGLSVAGGGSLNALTYVKPETREARVYYKGNVNGIFNIFKILNGEEFDENKEIEFDIYTDKDGVYIYNNMITDEKNKDKYIYTPNFVNPFDESGKFDIISAVEGYCENNYMGEKEKNSMYGMLIKLLPLIRNKIVFEEKDGKVYVSAQYDKEIVNEAVKLMIDDFAPSEEEIGIINRFLDDSDFSVVLSEVYEKGKFLSGNCEIKSKMKIEEGNIPIVLESNLYAKEEATDFQTEILISEDKLYVPEYYK